MRAKVHQDNKATFAQTHNMRAKKHFGQHFLQDPGLAQRIVQSLSMDPTLQHILEVGPGTGALTQMLYTAAASRLHLVEIDKDMVACLHKAYPKLGSRIHLADILQWPWQEHLQGPLGIIGNFPYNISGPLFFKILEHRDIVQEVVGLVQKEVGERLAAAPGSKTYGIPSVCLQAYYTVEILEYVPPSVFVPAPKVDSVLIRLRRNACVALPCSEAWFFTVVKAAFAQRRKVLRNALKGHTSILCPQALAAFGQERAERLRVEDFVRLVRPV